MQPQTVYSLSKSFTSAAIGIAAGEGKREYPAKNIVREFLKNPCRERCFGTIRWRPLPDAEDPEDRSFASNAHVTRVLAGYGMKDGVLRLRVFIPEMLVDVRIDRSHEGGAVKMAVHDVHNPDKPVE